MDLHMRQSAPPAVPPKDTSSLFRHHKVIHNNTASPAFDNLMSFWETSKHTALTAFDTKVSCLPEVVGGSDGNGDKRRRRRLVAEPTDDVLTLQALPSLQQIGLDSLFPATPEKSIDDLKRATLGELSRALDAPPNWGSAHATLLFPPLSCSTPAFTRRHPR